MYTETANYFFLYGSDVSHIEVDPISSVRGGHISRGSTEPLAFHDDSLGSFIQIRSQGGVKEGRRITIFATIAQSGLGQSNSDT